MIDSAFTHEASLGVVGFMFMGYSQSVADFNLWLTFGMVTKY
jgi:hypothetical protein